MINQFGQLETFKERALCDIYYMLTTFNKLCHLLNVYSMPTVVDARWIYTVFS